MDTWRRLAVATGLFGVAWLGVTTLPLPAHATVAVAESGRDAQVGAPPGQGEPAATTRTGPAAVPDDATTQRLGQKLRCPVCQGMPIGDSPAPMAQDMMRQVRRMRQAGRSEVDIERYFTERYGTWVLLDPPKEGISLWVWVLPPCALVFGVGYALVSMRRRTVARQRRNNPLVAAGEAGRNVRADTGTGTGTGTGLGTGLGTGTGSRTVTAAGAKEPIGAAPVRPAGLRAIYQEADQ